tara:strand:+ start:139 stop:741 length:603 start_codon:yes stop_codon:yes gene_type:complete
MKNKDLEYLKALKYWRLLYIDYNIMIEIGEIPNPFSNKLTKEESIFWTDYNRKIIEAEERLKEIDENVDFNLIKNLEQLGQGMTWKQLVDRMPTWYAVLSHTPKIMGKNKKKMYKIDVNGLEYYIGYNLYKFMEEVRIKYQFQRFLGLEVIKELHIEEQLDKYYEKFYHIFGERKELVKILFQNIKKPKGYWKSKIDIWL